MPEYITETDANLIYQSLSTLTEESDIKQADNILARYKSQQEEEGLPLWPTIEKQKQENYKLQNAKISSYFSDINNAKPENGFMEGEDSDDNKADFAIREYFKSQKYLNEDFSADDYNNAKNGFADQVLQVPKNEFNKVVTNNIELYTRIKPIVERQNKERQIKEESSILGAKSAVLGEDYTSSLSRFQKEKGEEFDIESFSKAYNARNSIIGPYKKEMDTFATSMLNYMDGKGTKADEDNIKAFSKKLLDLKTFERKAILTTLAAKANISGKEFAKGKTGIQEFGESFGRIYTDAMFGGTTKAVEKALPNVPTTGKVLTTFKEIKTLEEAEAFVKDMYMLEIYTGSKAEAERRMMTEPFLGRSQLKEGVIEKEITLEESKLIEEAKIRAQKAIDISREIQSISRMVDPIGEGIGSTIASTIGSSAALLPLAAAPGGVFVSASLYSDIEYNTLRSEYPTMKASDAENISLVSGAVQAGLDKLNINFIKKGLPNVSRLISGEATIGKALLKRGLIGVGTAYGVENAIEGAQDITTPVVQQLFNAFATDIPDVDWNKELGTWLESRKDVAIGLAPLVILGAGGSVYADKVNLDKILADDQSMQNLGILEGDRKTVLTLLSEGNKEEAANAYIEAFNRRDVSKSDELAKASASAPIKDSTPLLEQAKRLGIIPDVIRADNKYIVKDNEGNDVTFNTWLDAQNHINNLTTLSDSKKASQLSTAINEGSNLEDFSDITAENENDYLTVKGQLEGLSVDNISDINSVIGTTLEDQLTNQKELVNDIGIIDTITGEPITNVVDVEEGSIITNLQDRAKNAISNFIKNTLGNLNPDTKQELNSFAARTNDTVENMAVDYILNGKSPNTQSASFNQLIRVYQSTFRKALSASENVAASYARKENVVGTVKPASINSIIESKLVGKGVTQAQFEQRVKGKRISAILNPPKKYFKLLSKLKSPDLTPEQRVKLEKQIERIENKATFSKASMRSALNESFFNKLTDIFNNSNTKDELRAALKPLIADINTIKSRYDSLLADAIKNGLITDKAQYDRQISRINNAIGALSGMLASKVDNKTDYNAEFLSNNIKRYKEEAGKAANSIDESIVRNPELNVIEDTLTDFYNTTEEILDTNRFTLSALEDVDAMLEVLGERTTTDLEKVKDFEKTIRNKINKVRNILENKVKPLYISKINTLISTDLTGKVSDENLVIVNTIRQYVNASPTVVKEKLQSLENTLYPKDFKQQLDADKFKKSLIEYNLIKAFGNINDKSYSELVETDSALNSIWNGDLAQKIEEYTSVILNMTSAIESSIPNSTTASKKRDLQMQQGKLSFGRMLTDFFTNMSNSLLTFKSLTNIITNGSKEMNELSNEINDGFIANQDDINDTQNTLDTDLDEVIGLDISEKSKAFVLRDKSKKKSRTNRRKILFDMISLSSENKIDITLTKPDGSVENRKITQALAAYILNINDQNVFTDALARKGITSTTIAEINKAISGTIVDKLRIKLKKRVRENFNKSNKVFEELNGFRMSTSPDFFPVRIEFGGAPTLLDPYGIQQQSGGQRMGFDNATVDPNEELDLDFDTQDTNLISMFFTHSYETSHWRNLIKPLTKAKYIFNNKSIKDKIKKVYGQPAMDEINATIGAFESGGIHSGFLNKTLSKYLSRVTSNFAKNVMGYKLSTRLTNLFSIFNAGLDTNIPTKEIMNSYIRVISGKAIKSKEEIWASSAIQRRINSGSNSLIAMAKAQSTLSDPKWYDEFSTKSLSNMSKWDAMGGMIAAAAAFDAHYNMAKKSDPSLTEQELEELAFSGMMETINKTFQPSILSGKSTYEMNSNPILRFFTLFQSESRKNLGLEVEAFRTGKGLARTLIINHLVFGGFVWLMKSAIRDILDDEDDELFDPKNWNWVNMTANILTGPLASAPILGTVAEYLTTTGLNELIDALEYLDADTGIKKARTFSSSDNLVEKGFVEMTSSFNKIFKVLSGESDDVLEDSWDAGSQLIGAVSTTAPLSVFGLFSVVGNIGEQVIDITKSGLELFE